MLIGRTAIISAGGFTPSGSPVGHWSADTITGLEDTDPVGTWPDQSGNGYDASQATASKKPSYQTNELNGNPIVRFDGGDCLVAATWGDEAQPNTIFTVLKISGWGGIRMAYCGAVANKRNQINNVNNTKQIAMYAGSNPSTGKYFIGDSFDIVTAVFNGASSYVRLNTSQSGNVSVGTQPLAGVTIGSYLNQTGYFWNGDIAELIVYNSAEDPTDNESGLNTKYSIF